MITIKEWSESTQNIIKVFYDNLKTKLNKWFNNELIELTFDYFEYNTTISSNIYTAFLFFNDDNYTYKLDIIIDDDDVRENDDIVTVLDIRFFAYKNEKISFQFSDNIDADNLTDKYILGLIYKVYE